MSSGGRHVHRRRSHSASSPIRGFNLSDDPKWRFASKRARPTNAQGPSYKELPGSGDPPEKWDVDQWRRGKRARMETTSRGGVDDQYGLPLGSVFLGKRPPKPPPMPSLPCTPAAFALFPERDRRKPRRTSYNTPRPKLTSLEDEELIPSEELDRMRSQAFWELQRSVAESGEGFVHRMRDWENSRTRSSASPPRSRDKEHQQKRLRRSTQHISTPQPNFDANSALVALPDNDDDIEIVSGDTSSGSARFHIRSPSHKKRALSLGMMDVDLPGIQIHPSSTVAEGSDRCSSPLDASAGISACSSDEEELGPFDCTSPQADAFSTPALTHIYTNSTNSSLVSLPLSLSSNSRDQAQFPSGEFTFTNVAKPNRNELHAPPSASRSEKAIAALTLAMANGAGGLNDYAPLRFAEGTSAVEPPIDQCQIGELWH